MTQMTVREENGVTVIAFDGALDAEQVALLDTVYQRAASLPGQRIVVELSKVGMMATPALAMFIGTMKKQQGSGGRVIFTGTQGPIDRMIQTCRLDLIMTIVPTTADAVMMASL